MNWHPTFDPLGDVTRVRLVVRNETREAVRRLRRSSSETDDAIVGRLLELQRAVQQADTGRLTGRGLRRLFGRLIEITQP